MKIDNYGEIINDIDTYKEIAKQLKNKNDVIIGWTDGKYDHRDIYFSLENTIKYGNLQRGIKPTDLFVGIIDWSFFGFKIDSTKHPSYIFEKLRLTENDVNIKIAELINGIIVELNEGEKNGNN